MNDQQFKKRTKQLGLLIPESNLNNLMAETNEIISMIVSSIKTIRTRTQNSNPKSKI